MARDWVETFKAWAKPPSDTEEDKASRAARLINEAVRETQILEGRQFSVYPTGSYRNNTNVRQGSDVDIALVCEDTFFYALPAGRTAQEFGIAPSSYSLTQFRADLGRALKAKFGSDVTSGNKTFDIAANSSRLPADATPFLPYRRYTGNRTADGSWEYLLGVETRPVNDVNKRIINWHQEHYANGVAKNTATNRRYKRVARILKRMKADMRESGTTEAKAAAEPIPSFLLECLAYNCPDACFNKQEGSYFEDVKAVIRSAWNQTKGEGTASKMIEVNGRKLLFGPHQGWTRPQAHAFLLQAWQHVGFPS
jgi:hypothetical protein